jgi:hypothetical protein
MKTKIGARCRSARKMSSRSIALGPYARRSGSPIRARVRALLLAQRRLSWRIFG